MLGGSELTMDLTNGRRETVERCGEQRQEPRRNCARRERSQGETLHVIFHVVNATTPAAAAAAAAATAATRLQ